MPVVSFTQNLRRHVDCPTSDVSGGTVREALEQVFQTHPRIRGYVLDDQGALRRHIAIFVNGKPLADRDRQSDAVQPAADIYVMQALSGG